MTTFDELILAAEVALTQATKRREQALATVKFVHKRRRTRPGPSPPRTRRPDPRRDGRIPPRAGRP